MRASVSDNQPDHQVHATHCALAATGQLSQKDRIAFDTHCQHCASCRKRLLDMAIIGRELILHAAEKAPKAPPMSTGSLDRFLARAEQEGIALRSAPKWSPVHSWVPALSAVTLFAVMLTSMQHSRFAPTGNPIVANANAIATSDTETQLPTYTHASEIDRQNQRRPTRHTKHSISASLASAAPAYAESQWATLTSDRFSQTLPSAYPFFASHSAPAQAATYPSLSRAQVLHLALFRTSQEPVNRPNLGIAALYRPDALFPADRSFDFAPGMRQLRFQLPTSQ